MVKTWCFFKFYTTIIQYIFKLRAEHSQL